MFEKAVGEIRDIIESQIGGVASLPSRVEMEHRLFLLKQVLESYKEEVELPREGLEESGSRSR